MDSPEKMAPQSSLFQVYLRLRPAQTIKQHNEQWLIVEPPTTPTSDTTDEIKSAYSTHVTLQPPNESRKRAIERFGFSSIFPEEASQTDVFRDTGTAESIKNLIQTGRDGLVATLGVTGSGKSHTILGTKSQRGLTQMTLDVLFRSIGSQIRTPQQIGLQMDTNLLPALQACDPSEAQILSATSFLEMVYGDGDRARMSRAQTPMAGYGSRAQTPQMVWPYSVDIPGAFPASPRNKHQSLQSYQQNSEPHESRLRFGQTSNRQSVVHLVPSKPHGRSNMGVVVEEPSKKKHWRPPSKLPFWQRLTPKRKQAKISDVQDTMNPSHHSRRLAMPRPSTLAQSPDVSGFSCDVDPNCDYVVIISMYEVYNDRIFDLLSNASSLSGPAMTGTRHAAAISKGLTRRPLLFKNTELSSDRKVVAGLRKIVCSSYDEAMMVLETGLTERRVAGTGSNSVSSRSHGFFCIEVKKNIKSRFYTNNEWTGGTMSIVDLAGSERARNAKTTGSTLAEAGKINESLMYLGQCLQVQSDCQQDGSKPIVPFRQCKLTELLFSNSFPSAANASSAHRQPQRAVMIVTADPQGDFNATSQILRYSALAREVTVPRIPSVTSTIMGAGYKQHGERNQTHDYFAVELEHATNEVQRLSEECEILAVRLTEEEIKRTEAELKLQAVEERLVVGEQEIREECWQQMESTMEEEKGRWRAAWEEERQKGEEYLDGKIDILEKTSQIKIHSDIDETVRMDELERENDMLRAKLQALEQEMQTRSPTKKSKTVPKTPVRAPVLQENSNINIMTNPFLSSLKARDTGSALKITRNEDELMDASPRKLSLRNSSITKSVGIETDVLQEMPGTVKKKQRKLTTRKWDLGGEDEI